MRNHPAASGLGGRVLGALGVGGAGLDVRLVGRALGDLRPRLRGLGRGLLGRGLRAGAAPLELALRGAGVAAVPRRRLLAATMDDRVQLADPLEDVLVGVRQAGGLEELLEGVGGGTAHDGVVELGALTLDHLDHVERGDGLADPELLAELLGHPHLADGRVDRQVLVLLPVAVVAEPPVGLERVLAHDLELVGGAAQQLVGEVQGVAQVAPLLGVRHVGLLVERLADVAEQLAVGRVLPDLDEALGELEVVGDGHEDAVRLLDVAGTLHEHGVGELHELLEGPAADGVRLAGVLALLAVLVPLPIGLGGDLDEGRVGLHLVQHGTQVVVGGGRGGNGLHVERPSLGQVHVPIW